MAPSPSSPSPITELEQTVLDQYSRLAASLERLNGLIQDLAGQPTTQILDSLRELERKTGLVFTFFKASVYSIMMQEEAREQAAAQYTHDYDQN
ncbi:DASH complex subunit dad3 [Neolecta irregularis DAH-3]|uniref:DASH complex subunit DAD3 n=1 Tax=Neolecta irregularis (strain DAH-3) TaxID=1198029 RepID=A0A1U7LWT6_NEOID|nr:DASH complex subunit dad3 [Neolecta irregularis DAH-3]|eukprot:OLL27140.1 DASH complex subunit dad3 [Neolecta irregularis DAH-3]